MKKESTVIYIPKLITEALLEKLDNNKRYAVITIYGQFKNYDKQGIKDEAPDYLEFILFPKEITLSDIEKEADEWVNLIQMDNPEISKFDFIKGYKSALSITETK